MQQPSSLDRAPDARLLAERVRRLERQSRLQTLALAGAGVLLALTSLGGSDDVLRAKKFELLDDQGEARVELDLDEEGSAGLFVRDEDGRLRASVTHHAHESGLAVRDASGQIRLGALHFAHGGGGFALHGATGSPTSVLYQKGRGSLGFYDAEGDLITRLPEVDAR